MGHTILVATYHMLERKAAWNDLGLDDFHRRSQEASVRRLAGRIEAPSYRVAVESVS